MPEGIVLIDWDPFEGATVVFKYPEHLHIPENFIQLLQISQEFNPGIINIKEQKLHALSIVNEKINKVVVLILSRYEDADDFQDFIKNLNETLSESPSDYQSKLKEYFEKSQSVSGTKEIVFNKMADEISELKSWQTDVKTVLKWMIKNTNDLSYAIIYCLLLEGDDTLNNLKEKLYRYYNKRNFIKENFHETFHQAINLLEEKEIIRKEGDYIVLLIRYGEPSIS